jgi:DNA-binding transcriptional ArsR family regulator
MMDDLLNQITGLTSVERKRVMTWTAGLPEAGIVEIFRDGVKKAYQIKAERPDLPGKIGKYGAFILAARKAGWDTLKGKGYRVAAQEQYDDFSHLRKARMAELVRRGRIPLVRKRILAYWGEVKQLKAEGAGFRAIATYLQKTRRVKTSASYLVKLWHEVELDD